MSQIVQQIDNLRRRLQRRRVVAAVCWAAATLAATALVLSACDRLLGVGDLWGRILFTAAFAWVGLLVSHRGLGAVLNRPVASIDVAHRIERHHPELRDLVTSALEFSQQAHYDRFGGSESLRRAVVVRASVELEDIDWQQFVPRQPLRRAISAVGGALLVIGLVSWWAPQSLGVGLTRLLNPLSDSEWPRVNNLEFVAAPRTLAAGDDLVLQLRDSRGPLPDLVEIHYRIWRNQRWQEEVHALATEGSLQEVLRPRVQQSLEYRATGGDHHTMPWQKLAVVAPPRVKELLITVHPQAYTGIASGPLEKNGRVLVGSGLQLSGECDQPLAGVVLRGEKGFAISATLDSSGKQFHISPDIWHAEASDVLSLELTTLTGLSTRAAWRLTLEVVPDQPPEVRILEPTASLSVTPAAVVPLLVEASDDLAIRDVEIFFRRSDRSEQGDTAISLFHGPEFPRPENLHPSTARQQRLEYLWQLESLSLQPGSVVEVYARASDYQVAMGQTSYPLRLLVVSLQDLLRDISAEDIQLLAALERLFQEQSDLHELVKQWDQEQDRPQQRWLEAFRAVSSRQRRITTTLSDPHNGLLRSVQDLMDVYARNQLERQAAIEQLQVLHKRLSDLVEEPLQDIQSLLAELLRESRPPEPASIEALAERQSKVLETLRQVIESLSLENELARFESDLAQLETRQRELAEQSRREILAALSQTSRHSKSFATGEQAALQQGQLSRRFVKLVTQMSRAIESLSINSDSLSDTILLARELGVQATMRNAAEHLVRQQFGKASAMQRESTESLHRLRQRLAQGNTGEKKEGQVNTPRAGEDKKSQPDDSGDQSEGVGKAGTKPNKSSSPTKRDQDSSAKKSSDSQQLIKDLWGNLPLRQREQILQPLSEKFLPKYAEEIQAYFQTLAETDNAGRDSKQTGTGDVKSK